MMSIRNLNIRTKLLAIIMMISTVAVLLAGIIFIVFSLIHHKKDLAQERMSLAEVIGKNCKVILEFNFPEDAYSVLSSLEAKKSIVSARIYNKDGEIFSTYGRNIPANVVDPSDTKEDYYIFEKKFLHVFYHVRVNENVIGTVYLQDDMRSVYSHSYRESIALIFITLVVLVIAYFLSIRMQKMISGPILSLADLTNKVSMHKNYSLRAKKENDDEVGRLIDSFNSMLEQIRKQHEEIRESEERFKLALKGGDLGTWDWNIVTGHVLFSKRWVEMLGYTIEEIPSHFDSWKKLLHPDDAPRVMVRLNEHLEGKIPFYEVEFRLKTKAGGWKWILARGRIFGRDKEGNPLRSVGTHLDITERKEAEKERIDRDEKIRAILAAVPDLMIVMSSEGLHLDILTGRSDFFTLPRKEVIGRTVHDIFPEATAKSIQAVIDNTLNTRNVQNYEYMLNTGVTDRWFAALSVPFKYQNMDCILWAARDVTELKQAELEHRKMAAQLLQSQKMESIGTLAGGIAHDFNNILSIMLGNIELALDDSTLSESTCQFLQEVMTAGLRAKDLVQQLLNFSKKSDLKRRSLNVSMIIKDSLKLLRASIPKNIEIKELEMDKTCIISSDPIQIHQVMMNICTNAAHAMANDGGLLTVALSAIRIYNEDILPLDDIKEGAYAKITVSDTGHGISEKYIHRIFDPYFTTKGVGEGSGIGLSVVHGIVKNNNGSIRVDSVEGRGTTFTILLPLVEETPEIEKIRNDVTPEGKKERILFVDDEEMIVDIAENMLNRLGYKVTGKTCSLEALELFRSRPDDFDLIISDMSMPKMTGEKFAQKVMEIRPEKPFILCTGFTDRVTKEKAFEMGIRSIVMKPIVKNKFARMIRDVMDGREGPMNSL